MVRKLHWTYGPRQVPLKGRPRSAEDAGGHLEQGEAVIDEHEAAEFEANYPMARWGERNGKRFFGSIPMPTKVLFALPTLGFAAIYYMKQGYMTPFYTDDYPRASLSVIALFRVVATLIDCAWDPWLAHWTDSCKSRFGRRRPFILAACFLCTGAIIAGWQPPSASPLVTGIWFGVCDLLFSVLGTSMQFIAYNALGADLTPDYSERTGLWSGVELSLVIGILLGSVVPAFVVFGPDCRESPCDGCYTFVIVAACCGVLFYMLPQIALVFRARERPASASTEMDGEGVAQTIVSCLCNLPFRYLIISDIVEGVGSNLPLIVLPYVVRWIIGQGPIEAAGLTVSSMYALLGGVHVLIRVPFTFVWKWVAQRYGKVNTYIAFNFLYAVQMLSFLLIQEGTIILATVLSATWGVVYAGHWLLVDIITTIIDYDEFLEGHRREAQYCMILELIPKVISVFTEALPFLLMAYFGYAPTVTTVGQDDCSLDSSSDGGEVTAVESQPLGVEWTLRASFAIVPGVFGLLSALVLLKFPLRTQEQHEAIIDGIAKHRHGLPATDPFTKQTVPAVKHLEDGTRVVGDKQISLASFRCLSHFFPGELKRAIGKADLRALGTWPKVWVSVMLPIMVAGMYVVVTGFPAFVDGSFSVAPLGVVLVGFGAAFVWFQVVRLQQLGLLRADGVSLEDARFVLELRRPVPSILQAPATLVIGQGAGTEASAAGHVAPPAGPMQEVNSEAAEEANGALEVEAWSVGRSIVVLL